jgi:Spy/CpxP family protein refolding chaperone
MKYLKKINESVDINSYFHYLVHSGGHSKWQEKFNNGVEFLKSLNLTDEQYKKLGELFEEYGYFVRETEEYRNIDNEDY